MNELTNTRILDLIMRQYPLWPSSKGPCINSGDGDTHTQARGGGDCLYCLQRELERRIGKDWEIYDFCLGLEQMCEMYHELLEKMEKGE